MQYVCFCCWLHFCCIYTHFALLNPEASLCTFAWVDANSCAFNHVHTHNFLTLFSRRQMWASTHQRVRLTCTDFTPNNDLILRGKLNWKLKVCNVTFCTFLSHTLSLSCSLTLSLYYSHFGCFACRCTNIIFPTCFLSLCFLLSSRSLIWLLASQSCFR